MTFSCISATDDSGEREKKKTIYWSTFLPVTFVDHASEITKLNILCNLKQKIGFHASFDDYTKLECHRDIGKVKLDLVCFASFVVVVVFGCYLFAVVAVVLAGRGRRGAGDGGAFI